MNLVLLKIFFDTFMDKTNMNKKVSVHCSIRAKRLINIQVRKLSILASKSPFLGQNRLKHIIYTLAYIVNVYSSNI